MSFVPAICTQCGAAIDVDESLESSVCSHCGTTFVVQSAINNYVSNNVIHKHNYINANVVYMNEVDDFVIEGGVLVKYRGESTVVEIPEGVVAIGKGAFANTAISQVSFPLGVVEIREKAFKNCEQLHTLSFPESLREIENEAFSGCYMLANTNTAPNLISVGYSAFCNCRSLPTVPFSTNILQIGARAFAKCHSLTSVSLPKSLFDMGDESFSDCRNLSTVYYDVPNAPTYEDWFDGSFVREVTIGKHVKSLPNRFFHNKPTLKKVSFLPKSSCTSIGKLAFQDCICLEKVLFAESIPKIEKNAFSHCPKLPTALKNFLAFSNTAPPTKPKFEKHKYLPSSILKHLWMQRDNDGFSFPRAPSLFSYIFDFIFWMIASFSCMLILEGFSFSRLTEVLCALFLLALPWVFMAVTYYIGSIPINLFIMLLYAIGFILTLPFFLIVNAIRLNVHNAKWNKTKKEYERLKQEVLAQANTLTVQETLLKDDRCF